MSKGSGQKRFDDDILRCKEEILRIKGGIVPPFGQSSQQAPTVPKVPKSQRTSKSTPAPIEEKQPEQTPSYTGGLAFSDTATFSVPRVDALSQSEIAAPPEEIEKVPAAENAAAEPHEVETDKSGRESLLATIEEEVKAAQDESESDDDSEIPGFDLAQQIMAAQRKISGNRRRSPGSSPIPIKEEKPKPPAARVLPTAVRSLRSGQALSRLGRVTPAAAPMSPQQRIISEIVAKDINKFYQGSDFRK